MPGERDLCVFQRAARKIDIFTLKHFVRRRTFGPTWRFLSLRIIDANIDNYLPRLLGLPFPNGNELTKRNRRVVTGRAFHLPRPCSNAEIGGICDSGENRLPN